MPEPSCPEHGDLCGGADCCCADKHGTFTVLERLREASDGYLGCSWETGCRCIYCAAADEIERLRSWKAEATEVIRSWEQVWEALGRPGRLGEAKATAVLRAVGPDNRATSEGAISPAIGRSLDQ